MDGVGVGVGVGETVDGSLRATMVKPQGAVDVARLAESLSGHCDIPLSGSNLRPGAGEVIHWKMVSRRPLGSAQYYVHRWVLSWKKLNA